MREQGNKSGPNMKGQMGPLEGKANVQILNIDDGVCQFTVYQLKQRQTDRYRYIQIDEIYILANINAYK